MKLLVGLGNPGSKYVSTRHNVGFEVILHFADRLGTSAPTKKQYGALVGSHTFEGEKVLFALPQTFMNLSGQPVASLMGYYKCTSKDVIVLHDELALDFDTVRCKRSGGHGGHNGLRDIIKHIGNDFVRVRMGIGSPHGDQADYVLSRFNSQEQPSLESFVARGCDAIAHILSSGINSAMNTFNVRT
jgi:PTH1 family peptidyl-tRNA hydrolase